MPQGPVQDNHNEQMLALASDTQERHALSLQSPATSMLE
jgi:hypothetical protein